MRTRPVVRVRTRLTRGSCPVLRAWLGGCSPRGGFPWGALFSPGRRTLSSASPQTEARRVTAQEAAAAFFGGGAAGRAWAAGLVPGPGGLHPRVDRDVMVASVQENAHRDYWDAWDEVRCPVLVLRAGKGMLKQQEADRMAERRPGTRIVVVPDAGHDVHLDVPGAVFGEVAAFLAEVGPAAAV
ncbi:alpha/beta fold hydrolase [Streptomyces sp. NPDC058629]|uniref:alpha/beta fold hydrolase n=1 Tax=Streptomyces sp. NPDC058629 TaxID=3346565 RepID=UPI0036545B5F